MTLFDSLVNRYHPQTEEQRVSAQRETMQKIALAGLYRGGFFEHAAFYGGTCLRLMHGLRRFSEDMDFSLISKVDNVHLEDFFQAITDEFVLAELPISIQKKDKKIFGRVESAFLKENTETYDITFQTRKMMKVKIELDTDPPLAFHTEQCYLSEPYAFPVRCFTLPSLYAGKMHALIYRAWQRRLKGRDWYDFEWYVNNRIPLDVVHLQERVREFSGQDLSKTELIEALRERLSCADMEAVMQDVRPFLPLDYQRDLDTWSNDYFLQLADRIIWKE